MSDTVGTDDADAEGVTDRVAVLDADRQRVVVSDPVAHVDAEELTDPVLDRDGVSDGVSDMEADPDRLLIVTVLADEALATSDAVGDIVAERLGVTLDVTDSDGDCDSDVDTVDVVLRVIVNEMLPHEDAVVERVGDTVGVVVGVDDRHSVDDDVSDARDADRALEVVAVSVTESDALTVGVRDVLLDPDGDSVPVDEPDCDAGGAGVVALGEIVTRKGDALDKIDGDSEKDVVADSVWGADVPAVVHEGLVDGDTVIDTDCDADKDGDDVTVGDRRGELDGDGDRDADVEGDGVKTNKPSSPELHVTPAPGVRARPRNSLPPEVLASWVQLLESVNA